MRHDALLVKNVNHYFKKLTSPKFATKTCFHGWKNRPADKEKKTSTASYPWDGFAIRGINIPI